MSRAMSMRLLLLALAAGVVALWAFALTGLANPLGLPSRQAAAPRLGSNEVNMRTITPERAEDTQGGVTVRIVEARFSSSETHLLLEVAGLAPGLTLSDFSRNTTLSIAGVLGGTASLQSESAPPSEEGNARAWLLAGPVANVNEPLVLSLTHAGESLDAGMPPTTWRIAFTPGASAKDPLDVFVPFDQSIQYGRMTIVVKGAHVSSSQVSVYYDILARPGVSVDPVDGAGAKMVYPDGQEFLGAATPQFVETLSDGSLRPQVTDPLANAPYTVTFPLVRPSDEPFVVRFGRFIVAVPGPKEYSIPVDGAAVTVQADADVFQLKAGKDEAGNIVIRAQRLPGSSLGGFLVASVNKATLRDDLGNTYRFLNGETGFRKTETGEPVADRNVLVFAGPLDPGARQLYLAVPDSAEVLAPSGPAEISLP
jgi:hypothetical protein